MYAAKYLSTRYGKATKSDMTQVVKIIRRAKEEPTDIIIPNLGEPEEWILAGVVDASHRTSGSLFAVGGHVVMIINKNTLAIGQVKELSTVAPPRRRLPCRKCSALSSLSGRS